jgi:hypothetical protein
MKPELALTGPGVGQLALLERLVGGAEDHGAHDSDDDRSAGVAARATGSTLA